MAERRTLVLSVDRDDDLGYKAGLEGPVVGRDACIAAANALALVDPEDSDVNAIFQAVKIADGLVANCEEVEVAIVAGDHLHMIEGDRKIARDLERVIARTGATECILVTDGAEDDFVLPIIQSRIAVSSVRRVVVTQMVNLEGTYYILKKLLDDPKISRPLLVPVGLAMLLFAIAYRLVPEGAMIIVIGVIGVILFRGLGYDDIFGLSDRALASSLSHGRFTLVTNLAAVLLMIIGAITGITTMIVHYMGGDQSNGLFMVLAFAYGAIPWWVSAGLRLLGGPPRRRLARRSRRGLAPSSPALHNARGRPLRLRRRDLRARGQPGARVSDPGRGRAPVLRRACSCGRYLPRARALASAFSPAVLGRWGRSSLPPGRITRPRASPG